MLSILKKKPQTFWNGSSKMDRPDTEYELLLKLVADAKWMRLEGKHEIEGQKIDIIISHLHSMKKKSSS